jgi:hypothetical protein
LLGNDNHWWASRGSFDCIGANLKFGKLYLKHVINAFRDRVDDQMIVVGSNPASYVLERGTPCDFYTTRASIEAWFQYSVELTSKEKGTKYVADGTLHRKLDGNKCH